MHTWTLCICDCSLSFPANSRVWNIVKFNDELTHLFRILVGEITANNEEDHYLFTYKHQNWHEYTSWVTYLENHVATWKFKMAAIFQDGCNNRHNHIKFDRVVWFELSLGPFICFWGCRSWIYNSKATQKLASIIFSRSAGNKVYVGLYHENWQFHYCRKLNWK